MTRPLRIQFPGALYHVMTRGDHALPIFHDESDHRVYLSILEETLAMYHVILFAYVLMGNHVHLLIKTPEGNLSAFMQRLNLTFTRYFNRKHHRIGHLFQGRYRSHLVEENLYLAALSRYIHLNPVRTLAWREKSPKEKIEHLRNYPWSSLHGYCNKRKRQGFIAYDLLLAPFGGDTPSGRRRYWRAIREAVGKEEEQGLPCKPAGGYILGTVEFARTAFERVKIDSDEVPQANALRRRFTPEEIWAVVEEKSGLSRKSIMQRKSPLRDALFEMLYRYAGWSNNAIAQAFGLHYSTVSRYRKQARKARDQDPFIRDFFESVEAKMSKVKT